MRKKKSPEIDEKTITSIFRSVATEEIRGISSEDIQEIYFKKKDLYIKAIHPAVASEIWRKKENLIKKMNDITGNKTIKEIKIK